MFAFSFVFVPAISVGTVRQRRQFCDATSEHRLTLSLVRVDAPTHLDTARLLTQVAPLVFADDTFALKGGTAINLFVRDMPRLA
jgi:hypothetical protein